MALMNYLAILGLIAGAAYLVIAAIAFRHARKKRRQGDSGDDVAGRMILAIEDHVLIDDEPPYERMNKLGEICASIGQKIFNEKFDFTIESVSRLDRAIVKGWGDSDGEINPQVVLSFGAYLGEVLVRKTKGRWVTSLLENEPAVILFLAGEEETVSVSPFMMIREKFENMYKFDLAIAFTALEQKLKELEAV